MSIKTKLYTEFFKKSFSLPMEIIYWNGEKERLGEGEPEVIMTLHEPFDWGELKQDASIALAESYMDKRIEVEGSVKDLMVSAFLSKSGFMNDSKFKMLKIKQRQEDIMPAEY